MGESAPSRKAASGDPLLRPLAIRNTTFRNRVMSASHACGLEEGGMPTEAYLAYHEEKARGGIGLSMFGGSSNVDIDSPNIFHQINVGSDRIIPVFAKFSRLMHAAGAGLMCQITHLGRRGNPYTGAWLPSIAPSALREIQHGSIPKEMDQHDIRRVIQAYAAAARRCEQGGLDGIETLAGGHLIGQFLSPLTNRRSDAFGGSLKNRCRFALEVHEAIREAVSDNFLVGIRLVIDEGCEEGLHFDDCVQTALWLKEAGSVDFINAIVGRMDTDRSLALDNMPGMGTPGSPWIDRVGEFRHEVGLPVFHSARITDLATARHAVAEDKIDMVGMTRAHMADPHIIKKLQAGQEERIRPCVGATHCQTEVRPSCLHNVSTGRERTLPHVTEKTTGPVRKVAVIGAGPGGLEAARITAERGHEVSVYEALPEAGGQLRYTAFDKLRHDFTAIIDWRLAQLDRLGVPIYCNRYMEAEDVTPLGADIVILSTGGLPNMGEIAGGELCHSTWDLLGTRNSALSGESLVYDGTGRHPAPMAASRVLTETGRVHYVCIDADIGRELTRFERFMFKKSLLEQGDTKFTADSRLVSVERQAGRLRARIMSNITERITSVDIDHIFVEQGTLPDTDLYQALRSEATNKGVTDIEALAAGRPQPTGSNGRFALYRIGDAVASRNVHAAMLDAVRLCRTL